jgi:hypothetical protein
LTIKVKMREPDRQAIRLLSCPDFRPGNAHALPPNCEQILQALRGTPWFEHSLKLEVIRQSSISYFEEPQRSE